MKRGQVLVRALMPAPSERLVSADVLDLDDQSFRAFMVDAMLVGSLFAPIPSAGSSIHRVFELAQKGDIVYRVSAGEAFRYGDPA